MRTDRCAICNAPSYRTVSGDSSEFDCVRCGKYTITGTAEAMLGGIPRASRTIANLSGFVSENQRFLVDSASLKTLLNLPTPTVSERAEKLLFALRRRFPSAGQRIEVVLSMVTDLMEQIASFQEKTYHGGQSILNNESLSVLPLVSACWARDGDEFNFLLAGFLTVSKGYLSSSSGFVYVITANGWDYLENTKPNPESDYAFVAMSFNPELFEFYQIGIEPAVVRAGYKPIRIDRVEHVNRIDDEIIAMIRKSRFVVADLTEQKNGVYFETGFAQGLGLPVVWSCKKDDLDKVHFDTRQYNLLLWESADLLNFSKRLQTRIESIVGQGKYKTDR